MPDTKSPAPQDPTPQPFGPFVLERRIAVGGTAEVFYARPRHGQRPAPELVIKRLLPEHSQGNHYQTLSREAELHRAVRHENVVTVFGAGMVGNEPYLAMEYVAGVDLHRLLRFTTNENRSLPPFVAVYIARSVALALHAVHSACAEDGARLNITHGDVSPTNIYLSTSGDVKLGDFGVAHTALGMSADKSDSIKGKFGYLAPEQLVGDPFDQRADIFALGVVLGEMLVGGKIFPGNGQLAVLLSIREANIELLRRAADRMPAALFQSCTRALERDPEDRFADAAAFAASLESWFERSKARTALSEWVTRALDANVLARQFEQRLRNVSQANLAVKRATTGEVRLTETSAVRRANVVIHDAASFSTLLELAATGQLRLDDEVSLLGAEFRKVECIDELSRYLMPSTTTTTGQLFEPGVPDFTADLAETPMLEILARMRMRRESGALFVARTNRRGDPDRKDMYLSAGRLQHVASSDREELLGQYALRLKLISQEQLDEALRNLRAYGGRLGDTLIGLGMAEPTAVFRAIRNQGRDRAASLCCWRDGRVQLYRGSEAGHVEFRLDLDLSVPMMAGAMLQLRQGDPLAKLTRLHPGRRFAEAASEEERGGAPPTLLELVSRLGSGLPLEVAIRGLVAGGQKLERPIPEREARAAVLVAIALEWVRAE